MVELFNTWGTDALLTRNAYFLAYLDRSRVTEIERYVRQTGEGVALLMQDGDAQVRVTGETAGDQGEPLYDVEVRKTAEKRQVSIRVLPPERVKVSQFTPTYRLADCDYFEFWEVCTLSKLRADGFDVPDDIPDDESPDTEEDDARDLYHENRDDYRARSRRSEESAGS